MGNNQSASYDEIGHILPKNRIYPTDADFEDAWNYIDSVKCNENYNRINTPMHHRFYGYDLNYTICENLLSRQFYTIPLKGKYEEKNIIIPKGYIWSLEKLYTYMSHFVPWKFTITFISRPLGGSPGSVCISRIMDSVVSSA